MLRSFFRWFFRQSLILHPMEWRKLDVPIIHRLLLVILTSLLICYLSFIRSKIQHMTTGFVLVAMLLHQVPFPHISCHFYTTRGVAGYHH